MPAMEHDFYDDDEDMLRMDGFYDCELGIVDVCGKRIMCYSTREVVAKLISQGMTWEEATEYHYFNQRNAYLGEKTPCFMDDLSILTIEKT